MSVLAFLAKGLAAALALIVVSFVAIAWENSSVRAHYGSCEMLVIEKAFKGAVANDFLDACMESRRMRVTRYCELVLYTSRNHHCYLPRYAFWAT